MFHCVFVSQASLPVVVRRSESHLMWSFSGGSCYLLILKVWKRSPERRQGWFRVTQVVRIGVRRGQISCTHCTSGSGVTSLLEILS